MFSDELKLNAKKWDELERNRRMLFALLVKHMPNQAKELREICKSGRWTAHDKSLDLEPALAELRGIVVDACRLIGTSADPHAQPTQQTQPIGESSFGRGKLPAGDATQADGPKLPLRVEKVRDQYEQACELSHTDKLNNRAAYNLLEKANAEAKARKQPLPYPALDPFDNWCRYLREWRHATGQQRNKPRRGRTLAKQSG